MYCTEPPSPEAVGDIASLEIAAMQVVALGPETDGSSDPERAIAIRPVQSGEKADIWTVLARGPDGRCNVLLDLPSRKNAIGFARWFRRNVRAIRPEATIPIREGREVLSAGAPRTTA